MFAVNILEFSLYKERKSKNINSPLKMNSDNYNYIKWLVWWELQFTLIMIKCFMRRRKRIGKWQEHRQGQGQGQWQRQAQGQRQWQGQRQGQWLGQGQGQGKGKAKWQGQRQGQRQGQGQLQGQ